MVLKKKQLNNQQRETLVLLNLEKKGTKGNLYGFWIYIDEITGKAKAFEEEKKLVQRIFNMSETMGIAKIAKILKNEGVKSPLNKWKK